MLDFLGIGAQKAGTTWLCERLAAHPQVRFPGGKEVHFWDRQRDQGIAWYRELFAAAPPGIVQGEITPAYAILSVETIREVHREFPSSKLVYLLRNPIERAWSAALMWLQKMEMHRDEASDRWFLDQFRSQASRQRGDHAACLRNWASVYPAEQILVLRHEDLQLRPREVLAAVCKHLGIASTPFDDTPGSELARRVFEGPGHPLPEALRAALVELYAAPIADLEDLLGEDLSAWR